MNVIYKYRRILLCSTIKDNDDLNFGELKKVAKFGLKTINVTHLIFYKNATRRINEY